MSHARPLQSHGLAPAPPRGSVAPSVWGGLRVAVAAAVAIAIGAAAGLMLTAAAVRSDAVGSRHSGPWRLFDDVGSPAINPYQRARMAHTGEIPLASAQGLTLVARMDDTGKALDAACTYRVSGPFPHVGFWTLEAASTTGVPFLNPAMREAFTSADVLRDVAGRAVVTAAPAVQPGNWLPVPGAGHFELALRLYDAGLTGPGSPGMNALPLPSIARLGCGP